MMITDKQIDAAKKLVKYSDDFLPVHDHNDCIRAAYEWLDAQRKTKQPTRRWWPLKHLIEQWADRYISRSDVDVAAFMHPDIKGSYPLYNIEGDLTEPSKIRLRDLSKADTLGYDPEDLVSVYSRSE